MSVPLFARAAALAGTMLFLAALPAFSQAPAPAPATDTASIPAPTAAPNVTTSLKNVQWIWTGYLQGRFTATDARPRDLGLIDPTKPALGPISTEYPIAPSTFSIERAYLYLDAKVNKHIDGVANIELAPNPLTSNAYLLEGYGQYTFLKQVTTTDADGKVNEEEVPIVKTRLGFSRLPYGYEATLTSANLITLERSEAQFSLLYGDYSFDRGLFAYYLPTKGYGFNLGAAIANGTTMFPESQLPIPNFTPSPTYYADPDGNKNIVARAGYSFKMDNAPGSHANSCDLGASVYSGTSPLEGVTTNGQFSGNTMNREGYDLECHKNGFTLLSEGIWAKDDNIDSTGFYATLAYQRPGTKTQPYLRVDTYDSNQSVNNNLYSRATLGCNYYLTPTTKLTLEVQGIDNNIKSFTQGANPLLDPAPTGESSKVLVQYQVIF